MNAARRGPGAGGRRRCVVSAGSRPHAHISPRRFRALVSLGRLWRRSARRPLGRCSVAAQFRAKSGKVSRSRPRFFQRPSMPRPTVSSTLLAAHKVGDVSRRPSHEARPQRREPRMMCSDSSILAPGEQAWPGCPSRRQPMLSARPWARSRGAFLMLRPAGLQRRACFMRDSASVVQCRSSKSPPRFERWWYTHDRVGSAATHLIPPVRCQS